VSHTDADLVEAVRRGRREEFASFGWEGEPPDPQAEETFLGSKLQWPLRDRPRHREMLAFHRELLALRREVAPLASLSREGMHVEAGDRVLRLGRRAEGEEALLFLNFDHAEAAARAPDAGGPWGLRLDSADARWAGPGSRAPRSLEARAMVRLPPQGAVLFVGSVRETRPGRREEKEEVAA